MNPSEAYRIEALAWLAWLAYWLLAALRVKPTRQRATGLAPLALRFLMVSAAFVFFAAPSWLGPLARRFVPAAPAVLWVGLALTLIGLGFSIWARIVLGGNWSSAIVLKAAHELVRIGPYSRVRHPIYTGVLAAAAGAVLMLGRANGLIAFTLLATGFWIKARREERLLEGEFGAALDSYRSQTGMFLPRWRFADEPETQRSGLFH